MKKQYFPYLLIGLILSCANLFSATETPMASVNTLRLIAPDDPKPELKQAALEILRLKCNVCHKRQNPFKIFSFKNMDKHAPKIYQQVFVYQRMPKGDQIKLTDEESQMLKNWLKSKNIF